MKKIEVFITDFALKIMVTNVHVLKTFSLSKISVQGSYGMYKVRERLWLMCG